MVTYMEASSFHATPISTNDKGMLVDVIKEYTEIINNRNNKLYAV